MLAVAALAEPSLRPYPRACTVGMPPSVGLSAADYCIFFISGLPGGIDYVMQAMYKNKLLDQNVEKRWNAAINTYGCDASRNAS